MTNICTLITSSQRDQLFTDNWCNIFSQSQRLPSQSVCQSVHSWVCFCCCLLEFRHFDSGLKLLLQQWVTYTRFNLCIKIKSRKKKLKSKKPKGLNELKQGIDTCPSVWQVRAPLGALRCLLSALNCLLVCLSVWMADWLEQEFFLLNWSLK